MKIEIKKKLKYYRETINHIKENLKRLNPGNFAHTLNNQLHLLHHIEYSIKNLEERLEKEELNE